MGCTGISSGFTSGNCKSGMSGVKALWIANYSEQGDATPDYATRGLVTDIDDNAGSPAPLKFYQFPLPIDIGSFTEEGVSDPKLGTSFVTVTINGTVLELSGTNSELLNELLISKQVIIAELYNKDSAGKPKYMYLGEQNGVDITGGGSRSGEEASSLQGYEITFTGKESKYARFVSGAKVKATSDYITVGTP